MPDSDEPTDQERATIALVAGLRADGDAAALIALLQDGRQGPESVRDALTILADLDPELIVQVALDALIQAHVHEAVAAQRPAGSSATAPSDPRPSFRCRTGLVAP